MPSDHLAGGRTGTDLAAVAIAEERRAASSNLLRTGIVAALAAAAVVSPWVLRNWKILGSPVLTTTHGGYTCSWETMRRFFIRSPARPLLEEWRDSQPDRFQQPWFKHLVAEMDREIGPARGRDGAGSMDVPPRWRAIAAEPRLFLRACLLAVRGVLERRSPVPVAIDGLHVWSSGACGAGYAIELALFVVGLGTLFRRWDDRWTLPLLLVLNFTLVHLLYWSNMRMRAPLVPVIALVAASRNCGKRQRFVRGRGRTPNCRRRKPNSDEHPSLRSRRNR